MKSLKVLSLVAMLAPGISFAEATDHHAAHEAAKPATEHVDHAAAPAAQAAPAEHGTVQAKPAATAQEKTDKKSFCAKTKEEASSKCSDWVGQQKTAHKDKFVNSKCSEAAAASKTDKACKTGSQVSHGEVTFHK